MALSGNDWIAIRSGALGSGSGQVRLTVAANTSDAPRLGGGLIAGQIFVVGQEAAAPVRVSGSVSSIAGRCPSLTFRVDGRSIATDQSTSFYGGSCGEIRNKARVTVTGMTQLNGTVHATRVDQ